MLQSSTLNKPVRLIAAIILLFSVFTISAQTTMQTGSMAIIGWNADDDDDILLLALQDLDAGTVFYLSDANWDGTAFVNSEGHISYTAPTGGISMGDVILISDANSSPSASDGGSVSEISGFNLSGSGDELYLYQGTDEETPTVFVYAISNQTSWDIENGELANTGLVDGETALALWGTGDDNGQYKGITKGNRQRILSAIANEAYWETTDGSGDQSITFNTTNYSVHDLTVSATVSPTSAANSSDGAVTLNISGGTAPYTTKRLFYSDGFENIIDESDFSQVTINSEEQDGYLKLTTNVTSGWNSRFVSTNTTAASDGLTATGSVFIPYSGYKAYMIGFHDGGSNSTTSVAYGIYFFDNGTTSPVSIQSRQSGSALYMPTAEYTNNVNFEPGRWFDWKIELGTTGASYSVKPSEDASFTNTQFRAYTTSPSPLELGVRGTRNDGFDNTNYALHSQWQVYDTQAATSNLATGEYGYLVIDTNGNEAEVYTTIEVNNDPVFTSPTEVNFEENNTEVAYTITATDDSAITFSLGTGNDESLFTINSAEVSFITAPDFESKSSYTINVIAEDEEGNVANQNVTISVTNLDEAPTLSGTGLSYNYIEAIHREGGDLSYVFENINVDAVDAGQLITSFSIELHNLDGMDETFEGFDGSTINLSNTSATTANNSLTMSRALVNGVNTMTFTSSSGISAATFNSILNGFTFNHAGLDPGAGDRQFVLKEVVDSGDDANGNANRSAFSITSTITIIPVDTAPLLNTIVENPNFTEGDNAVTVFRNTSASSVESTQTLKELVFTVSGLADGSSEIVIVDGVQFELTDGQSANTTANPLNVSITETEGIATITLSSAAGLSNEAMAALVDGIMYQHTSENPTSGNRSFRLTRLSDSGQNSGNDNNTTQLDQNSVVQVVTVNDNPSFTSSSSSIVNLGEDFNYTITTADVDGDQVDVTATVLPNWLSLSKTSLSSVAGSNKFYQDGSGTEAGFSQPGSIVVGIDGNIYVADWAYNVIRKVTPEGVVSTFAGTGNKASVDGVGTNASFNSPTGIASDLEGNFYVVDNGSHTIRKIDNGGVVTTLAGSGTAGDVDGVGTNAEFNYPHRIAVDASGNLYILDSVNNKVKRLTPNGEVITWAGSGAEGSADGTGTQASFWLLNGITVDPAGNVYTVSQNNVVRKISTDQVVTTYAGSGSFAYQDGPSTSASFANPGGLRFDSAGNLYVADFGNNRIRRIDVNGAVTTIAGNDTKAVIEGINGSFDNPIDLDFDQEGNAYVMDWANGILRKMTFVPATIVGNSSNQRGEHSVSLLASDGNGGSSEQHFIFTVSDLTPPEFTSSRTQSFDENSAGFAYTAITSDLTAVTYSLGTSKDEGLFNIAGSRVTFELEPDYENPLDADANNVYLLDVIAIDEGLNESTLELEITVTDVDDIGPTVVSLDPLDGTSIPANQEFQIEFDEPVFKGGGVFEVVRVSDQSALYTVGIEDVSVSIENNVVTIRPNIVLPTGENTAIQISFTAFVDQAGNHMKTTFNDLTTWNHTITDADVTGPVIENLSPADGSSFNRGQNVTVTFNEDIQAGSGKVRFYRKSDGFLLSQYNITDSRVQISGNKATVKTPANIDLGVEIFVHFAGNSITDALGNELGAAFDENTWNLTAANDNAPTINSFSPVDGSSISPGQSITVTFSEPVFKNNGLVRIYKKDGPVLLRSIDINDSEVLVNGAEVTIVLPNTLALNQELAIHFAGGALIDEGQNDISGVFDLETWNLTTVQDFAPTISNLSPADESTVEQGEDISVTFSETVFKSNGRVRLYRSSNLSELLNLDINDPNIALDGATLTLTLPENLPGGQEFFVHISKGALEDSGGNNIDGLFTSETWNLTRNVDAPPSIQALSPIDGGNFNAGTNLTVTFNENVTKNNGKVRIYKKSDSQLLYQVDINNSSISVNGAIVTIRAPRNLPSNEELAVHISKNALVDSGGNDITGLFGLETWNVTQIVDPSPTITSLSPADGSLVNPGSDIEVTFNEDVFKGRGKVRFYRKSDLSLLSLLDINSGNVTIDGAVVSIRTPSNLPEGVEVAVHISPKALEDSGSNDITGLFDGDTWNLTPQTDDPPTISSLSPADGTSANMGQTVTASFSEAISKNDGRLRIYRRDNLSLLYSQDINDASIVVSGSDLSFDLPVALPTDVEFLIHLSKNAIEDGGGNSIQGLFTADTWNLTISSGGAPVKNSEDDAPELPETQELSFVLPPLSVYPNPTTGIITVDILEPELVTGINIVDAVGRSVFLKASNIQAEEVINLSESSSGILILNVAYADRVERRKILLKR